MRILLQNGLCLDGTGNAAFPADVLLDGERVAQIGPQLSVPADQVIDVSGLCIAPGFIDAHSHNDWFVARPDNFRFFAPFLEQGITTQVTGNCGFSPFGYEPATPHLNLLGSGLFSQADAKGDLSALGGFEASADSLPLNIAPLYGHMSARISVAGYDSRPLTETELERVDALTEAALQAGAGGVSLGLMYEPDRYAPYEELLRAARLCQKYDVPLTVHARACSAASTSYSPPVGGRAHNLRALDEMLALSRETGVKLQFSHLIFVGEKTWKTMDEALLLIHERNAEGGSFFYDSYAMLYGASVITVVLPSWYLSLPVDKRQSAWVKARMAVEIGVTKKLLGFDFTDIVIAYAGEKHTALAGKTVRDIAREKGMSDLSAYLWLVDETEGKGRVLMHKYLTPEILDRLMSDDHCLCMTDAWLEEAGMQNPACFSCYPEFLRLARERDSLPFTVRQMTGATADRFALRDRGYLREGGFADVTVFDPRTVAPDLDPEKRPHGIRHVFVNGQQVVADGQAAKASAGRMLLRQRS